jgi:hypothetical protein
LLRPSHSKTIASADPPLRRVSQSSVIKSQHSMKICSVLIRNTVAPIGIPTAPRSCRRKKKTGVSHERQHPPGPSKKVRTALGRQISSTGCYRASTPIRWERSGAAAPQPSGVSAPSVQGEYVTAAAQGIRALLASCPRWLCSWKSAWSLGGPLGGRAQSIGLS